MTFEERYLRCRKRHLLEEMGSTDPSIRPFVWRLTCSACGSVATSTDACERAVLSAPCRAFDPLSPHDEVLLRCAHDLREHGHVGMATAVALRVRGSLDEAVCDAWNRGDDPWPMFEYLQAKGARGYFEEFGYRHAKVELHCGKPPLPGIRFEMRGAPELVADALRRMVPVPPKVRDE